MPLQTIAKLPIFKIELCNINNIISRVLWSRWYLGAVFWHLMYHYERQAAKACPALILFILYNGR